MYNLLPETIFPYHFYPIQHLFQFDIFWWFLVGGFHASWLLTKEGFWPVICNATQYWGSALYWFNYWFAYSLNYFIHFIRFTDTTFSQRIGFLDFIGIELYLDMFSLFFIILILLMTPLSFIWIWEEKFLTNWYLSLFISLNFCLILCFLVKSIFMFFFFFECLLIPMFIFVGFWGSRFRRSKAAYLLALYTLVGSVFLLLALFLIFLEFQDFKLEYVYLYTVPFKKKLVIWLCLFLGFAVKVPLFPVHIWLPEAHVEAPTLGSVLLAAFLLKLGIYGLVRFAILPFYEVSLYVAPFVSIFSLLGIIYCALTAIRQIDIKKIIAYSSVSHMNFCILGLFSFNVEGLEGSFLLMLGHGLVSAGLFFLVGALYDRYHSKLLHYYGGLAQTMPIFSFFFFIFILANFSFPGTINFIGEALILLGLLKNIFSIFIFSSLGIFFNTCFSILSFNKVIFGPLKTLYIFKFQDLSERETNVLAPLLYFTILLGIRPGIVLDHINPFIHYYLFSIHVSNYSVVF